MIESDKSRKEENEKLFKRQKIILGTKPVKLNDPIC